MATGLSCYEEIKDSTTHRLVRLSLNQNGQHIQCELIVTALPENGRIPTPYRALSYCWGSETRDKTILVTNKRTLTEELVRVTDNLHDFLSATLAIGNQDWWFIDAICINQEDFQERAHQVWMMGRIYQHAYRTTVWLGHRDAAIEALLDYYKAPVSTDRYRDHVRQKEIIGRGWRALERHSYWTRLWVIPEFLLSQSIEIQIGQSTLWPYGTWVPLDDVWEYGWTANENSFSSLIEHTKHNEYSLRKPLMDNMSDYAGLQCADPRDMVYALLPISHDGADHITIDYTVVMEELFLRLPWHTVVSSPDIGNRIEGMGISSQSLTEYTTNLGNGRDHFMPLENEAYVEEGRSVLCSSDGPVGTPEWIDTKRSAVYCACRFFRAAHFLLCRDETAMPFQNWVTIGLLDENGNLIGFPSPNFHFSWATSLKVFEMQRGPSYLRAGSHRVKVSITRFAFASLVERAMTLERRQP